jgi:hypothetical protein
MLTRSRDLRIFANPDESHTACSGTATQTSSQGIDKQCVPGIAVSDALDQQD